MRNVLGQGRGSIKTGPIEENCKDGNVWNRLVHHRLNRRGRRNLRNRGGVTACVTCLAEPFLSFTVRPNHTVRGKIDPEAAHRYGRQEERQEREGQRRAPLPGAVRRPDCCGVHLRLVVHLG